MKAEMAKSNCEELYELREVNIETDENLSARYRYDIPVLEIDGVEAFRHRLSADAFREWIAKVRDQAT